MSSPIVPAQLDAEQVRVGATLRQFRELRGLKVGELANLLNISYAYLSNIEAGRKPLTETLLAKAAGILNVRQIAIRRPDLIDTGSEIEAAS